MYRGRGKWSGRAVSRQLGVSHTYIQKLVREYAADPSSMLRDQRLFGPATLDGLRRARCAAWATGPVTPHYLPIHIRRRQRWRPGMRKLRIHQRASVDEKDVSRSAANCTPLMMINVMRIAPSAFQRRFTR